MLIKLVPPSPYHIINFTISFPNLPPNIQLPQSWLNQLTILNLDDLDVPQLVHALDKSTFITSLLHEITFDLATLTISCILVDGSKEEWPLMSPACLGALESVISDVAQSTVEEERKAERHRRRELERERIAALSNPSLPPAKPVKHKKQRSLLMSLVASLVPSSRSTSQAVPPLPPLPPLPTLSPNALRHRARSTLVDTYRLHVLTELTGRMPPGGYYAWIAHSTLRRITTDMNQLLQESGDSIPALVHTGSGFSHRRERSTDISEVSPPPTPVSTPSCDEGSEDTDTDGSSLHTPTSSSIHNPAISESPSPTTEPNSTRFSPSPAHKSTPSATLARYTSLAAHAHRLRHLLMIASSNQAHEDREIRHREAMLEIRCKRRAWLNKRLVGGTATNGVGMRDGGIGMAMPFERSPLGMWNWVPDDVVAVRETGEWTCSVEEAEDDSDRETFVNPLRRKFSEMKLFPVYEEDEVHSDEPMKRSPSRELEREIEVDLEEGWLRPLDDDASAPTVPMDVQAIERPQVVPRIRVRTSSMHLRRRCAEAFEVPAMVGFAPHSYPQRPRLPPNSILCQPLKSHLPDEDGIGYEDEEFTLAMDLPFKSRRGKGGEPNVPVYEKVYEIGREGFVDCR